MADETPTEVKIKSIGEAPDTPMMPSPPTTGRLIGAICCTGHHRITYYERYCPLCTALELCKQYLTANVAQAMELELLRNERVYLKSCLFAARDKLIVVSDKR